MSELLQLALKPVADVMAELRAENERLRKAIADEPELPGAMPDGMWDALVEMIAQNDREATEEWMRIIVRETKQGIVARAALRPSAGTDLTMAGTSPAINQGENKT